MTTVLVAGALANKAGNGGAAWTRLSWALGFRRLGFDVHLVEELAPGAPGDAVAFFRSVTEGFGLPGTLLDHAGLRVCGLARGELLDLAATSPMLVNISGHLRDREVSSRPHRRVFVDLDPGYTQLWHLEGAARLEPHDHWYTVGTALGRDRCRVPTAGLPWRPTLQPVLLDEWPIGTPLTGSPRFTSVGSWRGPSGTVALGDIQVGPKVHQFRRFVGLPRQVTARLELALDIDPADSADRLRLLDHGWHLVGPLSVAGDPWTFREYIRGSHGEWSVAQGLYVETRCGWVSDRTTRYLASGRPAVVQDTGLADILPLGEGLVTFDDLPGAVAGLESVIVAYERHAAAARALAEEYFSAEVVLGRICEDVDVAP